MKVRVSTVLVLLAFLPALLALPSTAFAFDEPHNVWTWPWNDYMTDCGGCHLPTFTTGAALHGGYTTSTNKCEACHDVHVATGGLKLLPGDTVQASCFTCHDGTGGWGVYGAIAFRGATVGAQHRCETTNVVPGGDALTGDAKPMAFGGQNGTLSCDDCHSPHATPSSVVATFTQERLRYSGMSIWPGRWTNNLLKQRPGNSTSSTPVYGSDWCGACHKGRLSGSGMPNNHPVESTLVTSAANVFTYQRASILATDAATSTTVYGPIAQSNRGYLMTFPRTPQQRDHKPICQQCHEDSRNVGSLDTTGSIGDAALFTVVRGDGITVTVGPPATFDNPRFQNFPHETQNRRFLVETDDDLCLNCHPPAQLP